MSEYNTSYGRGAALLLQALQMQKQYDLQERTLEQRKDEFKATQEFEKQKLVEESDLKKQELKSRQTSQEAILEEQVKQTREAVNRGIREERLFNERYQEIDLESIENPRVRKVVIALSGKRGKPTRADVEEAYGYAIKEETLAGATAAKMANIDLRKGIEQAKSDAKEKKDPYSAEALDVIRGLSSEGEGGSGLTRVLPASILTSKLLTLPNLLSGIVNPKKVYDTMARETVGEVAGGYGKNQATIEGFIQGGESLTKTVGAATRAGKMTELLQSIVTDYVMQGDDIEKKLSSDSGVYVGSEEEGKSLLDRLRKTKSALNSIRNFNDKKLNDEKEKLFYKDALKDRR